MAQISTGIFLLGRLMDRAAHCKAAFSFGPPDNERVMRSVLLSVLVIATAAGQTPPREKRLERGREFLGLAPPPDAAAAAEGQKIYEQNCAFCHGVKATGAEGPNLVRSTVVLHDEKGELIGAVVHSGRPDRGMPAFPGLSPQQIYDVAEFLHSRVEAAANRFGYKVGNVITGDPKAGQKFFEETGHCGQCHSVTGDLAHIASKYEPADLQAQFLYPTTSPASAVTVVTPSGETITGTLKRVDDFNVSLWDKDGAYHSWPRKDLTVTVKDPLAAHRELLERYTNQDMHNVLAYLETLK
jgi:mono/diheme cytochrome c family protein